MDLEAIKARLAAAQTQGRAWIVLRSTDLAALVALVEARPLPPTFGTEEPQVWRYCGCGDPILRHQTHYTMMGPSGEREITCERCRDALVAKGWLEGAKVSYPLV